MRLENLLECHANVVIRVLTHRNSGLPDLCRLSRTPRCVQQVRENLKQKMWDATSRWDPAERQYAKSGAGVWGASASNSKAQLLEEPGTLSKADARVAMRKVSVS